MQFHLSKIACLCILVCCGYCVMATGQARPVHTATLRSKQVTVNSFEWALDKTTGITRAEISITNHSRLAIKSVTALFTGQGKGGIMLQSNGVRTIRRKSVMDNIPPEATKIIIVEQAFKNTQLETLKLMQLDIVFDNNSVETVN